MGYPQDTVVIESVEWPGYYLRHASYMYNLRSFAQDSGFARDAIFYMHNDSADTRYIYAKSAHSSFLDYYLRPLSDNTVRLATATAEDFQQTHFYPVGG